MTTAWQAGTTIARRVRVKGVGLDPTLTQLRMASLLNATDMQPAGLASSSIVCIRTLRTPCHVSLSLQHGGVRPPRAWEQSINSILEEMIRHAAYPILGPVPANSQAIVFNDTAELLACMAADQYEGLLHTRWWWKSLFKTSDVTSILFPTWLTAPAYAPAALQHLATRNLVIPFVRSLNSDNARLLLQKILHTFSLPALYHALYSSENDIAIDTSDEHVAHVANYVIRDPFITPTPQQYVAPWQHIVPEAERNELSIIYGLYHDQQCLLGIGLMLHRAPMRLRTHSFAQAVQRWQRTIQTAIVDNQAPLLERDGRPTIVGDGSAQGTIPTAPALGLTHEPTDETPLERDEHPILVGQGKTGEGEEQKAGASPPVAHGTPATDEIPPERDERPIIVEAGSAQGTIPTAPALGLTHEPTDETPPGIHIDTALGGLFYLINLALFLNLYSDFTAPINTGIELSIWDFIALLGHRLLGDTIKQDPIWPLLAQLAERDEHDEPGRDFTPPAIWQIPAEWLKQFSGNEEEWATEKGFEYGEEPLRSWLNWVMPHIYARLQHALNLDAKEQIAPMLVMHDAHVRVTATHLDVFFSLNTLPIEIRLAGLDRNPGWVPAAGRFIAFHFS